MGIFKKKEERDSIMATNYQTEAIKPVILTPPTIEIKPTTLEPEYEWIEGYKGTDSNMCCRGYQFELGKTHVYKDEEIQLCKSGFHLCRDLADVPRYYPIGNGNRYFKVRAKVLKGEKFNLDCFSLFNDTKEVAKVIEFIEEVSISEILWKHILGIVSGYNHIYELVKKEFFNNEEYWVDYLNNHGAKFGDMINHIITSELTKGYSEPIVTYLTSCCNYNKLDTALNFVNDNTISNDMKIVLILTSK